MNFHHLVVVIVTACLTLKALGQGETVAYSLEAANRVERMDQKSWSLGINFGLAPTDFAYREEASATNFNSLNSDVGVNSTHLQLIFGKEIWFSQRYSFTVLAEYGVIDGKEDNTARSGTPQSQDYQVKTSGSIYGAGMSLNINLYSWGYRIQPFFSSKYVFEKMSAQLSYSRSKVVNSVITDFNTQGIENSLGFRVFDDTVNLFSHFAIEHLAVLDQNFGTAGQVNDNARFPLAGAEPQRNPLSLSIGFGAFF